MTLTLDLLAADEAALRDEAARNGQAPDVWARDALSEVLRTRRAATGTSGATANGLEYSGKAPEQLTASEVLQAPPDVREAALQANAQASAEYYASPEGKAEWEELADWRALDGEPFHDDAGDYYSAEEEAQFRATKTGANAQ